jgi:hypothetical protein
MVAALSGAAVAVPFNPADGYGSLATMLLTNPSGTFFRNLHYWAGQACLILSVLHIWDHLKSSTEQRVRRGVWLRLSLTLPLLIFIMLSGFMLRGDADARQALRIVTEALSRVPLVGAGLATFAFGIGGRLDVVYVQHAATATILVWLFIIEHARRVWPKLNALLSVLLATGGLSLFLSPGLHDGLDPIIKGPWYFLGLQEILHWTPWPLAVVVGGALLVAGFYGIHHLGARGVARMKRLLLVGLALYLGLCGVGALLRGQSWAWDPAWPAGPGDLKAGWIFVPAQEAPAPLPLAMGRPEGCLVCHPGVTGLGNAHKPEAIGCAACHGGDTLSLNKDRAHAGMILIPGNLSTAARTCGTAECHSSIIPRVEQSLMATMRGVVEIDRVVFAAAGTPKQDGPGHIQQLGYSPADTHLRQLCASCHLGALKTELGPIEEDFRHGGGGGCLACHLNRNQPAREALRTYLRQKLAGAVTAPKVHSSLDLQVGNGKCFGCHSRSGRISTSYEGWHEMHEPPPAIPAPTDSRYRVLPDERVFERARPDVHQQRGLECVDCHIATEVMGDGKPHARKSAQVRLLCVDCHAPAGSSLPTLPASGLDPESRRILALRRLPGPLPKQFIKTRRGDALVNAGMEEATGKPRLMLKRDGLRKELKPTAAVCVEGAGHARLSCGSCHTAWAPTCTTCHTSRDEKALAYDWLAGREAPGKWKEQGGPFLAAPPTLGIRETPTDPANPRGLVETFVPGMVLTLALPDQTGPPAFRRLYARIEPHTTQKGSRSCVSCHNNPVALGYGRGDLRYERTPRGGRWTFRPAAELLPGDGLPADAWIPFLGTRSSLVSTRADVRPFTLEEQQRILQVGACLTCHDERSAIMRNSVHTFKNQLAKHSPRCLMPIWN